ncbi:MAG: hypothetical protein ACYTEI_01465 [Planctomycetota bacterium]|jgi:hypothetical protein
MTEVVSDLSRKLPPVGVNADSGLCMCFNWIHLLQSGGADGEMTARLREAWLELVERETS